MLHPGHASRADPVEAHSGPLRQFTPVTPADSHHPDRTVRIRALCRCPRRRNANARHPDVLAAGAGNAPAAGRVSAGADGRPVSNAA
ncbi:hypothetical protein [Streptomyces somaliensis]|uniref:hypothetical protein n=1 Tax=Streptomyces somaliensis TaxID=78355 RepID=UPI0027E3C83B|nr:hypothetical protein [Streptomyces somaliensis]